MYSYVLASVQDPDDQQRINLSSALARMGPIEHLIRLGVRSQGSLFAKITDAEAARRREWLAISQRGPPRDLSGATYESSKMFRYPLPSEFDPKTAQSQRGNKRVDSDKGAGKGNPKRGKYDSYGGIPPSVPPPSFRRNAPDGIRAQGQQRLNRNAWVCRLAQNTGFAETEPGD